MSQRRVFARPTVTSANLDFITEEYLLDEIERAFQINEKIALQFRPPMPGRPQRVLDQVGRQAPADLLEWLYRSAMPDAVDHLDLAALINERAGQVVPLFHLQLEAVRQSYQKWTHVYDLMGAAAQAMNRAKQIRHADNRATFYRGWSDGLIPVTLGVDNELTERLRHQRHLIEYSPSPQQWFELTDLANIAARTLAPAELSQFKVRNAMASFGIPHFMAEQLTAQGLFGIYNGVDYVLHNRRMGFARIATIIVDYILDQ